MPRAYVPSRAVRRWLESGLSVSPEQLEKFQPDTSDVAIARVMQEGALSVETIVTRLAENEIMPDLEAKEIRRRLAEPVRAAWLNRQVLEALPHKTAQVYFELLRRALAGQVDAARLFLTRFDRAYRPTTRREVVSAGLDVKVLSDNDLLRQLTSKIRELLPPTESAPVVPPAHEAHVEAGADPIDVEFEVIGE